MINKFGIRNFKSIEKIILNLNEFNILIGLNGAGKSTLLQSIDFVSHVMRGDISGWLDRRDWNIDDLNCKFIAERYIRFRLGFSFEDVGEVAWEAAFSRQELFCIRETVEIDGEMALSVKDGHYQLLGGKKKSISFKYEGSILSALREEELSDELIVMRDYVQQIRSLDMLSPHLMRHRSRDADDDIGHGGERLSAFLYGLKGEKKDHVLSMIKSFYPQIVDFKVASLRSGWKRLSVFEEFQEKKVEVYDKHINDGLLRVLAIIAQSETPRSFLIFDEVENGINPEVIERLISLLEGLRQQILVTTHSPMVLNYLTDDVARSAVIFVYKTETGDTRARQFFDIPRTANKLDVMGPGEAFVDTDLYSLTNDCIALDASEAARREKS